MKALVVYDAGGSTEQAAKAICSGMKQMGTDVECKSTSSATVEDFQKADMWVLGSAEGWFKPSGKLKKLIQSGAAGGKHKAVTFDARVKDASTGAGDKVKESLKAAGVNVVGDTYFVVGSKSGPLMEGEDNMASVYGKTVAQM